MNIEIFDSFHTIPGSINLSDKVPVFALPVYAEWIALEKGYKTIWFVKHNTKFPLQIIPFAVLKKGPFIKGMFLTEVLNFAENFSPEEEKIFLNEIIIIIKKRKICHWVQQSPNWAIFRVYPDNSKYIPYGTYYIDLESNTEENLLQIMKPHTRKDIFKAEASNVNLKFGKTCLNDLFTLIKNTSELAKISYPTRNQIDQMFNHFHNNISCVVAYYNDIPQAGVIILLNRFRMYGMYLGTKSHPVRGASAYMFYHGAYKFGKTLAIKTFDFTGAIIDPVEGSKDDLIQKFKASLGAQLKKGFIWKVVISPTHYFLYYIYAKAILMIRNKKNDIDIINRVHKLKTNA